MSDPSNPYDQVPSIGAAEEEGAALPLSDGGANFAPPPDYGAPMANPFDEFPAPTEVPAVAPAEPVEAVPAVPGPTGAASSSGDLLAFQESYIPPAIGIEGKIGQGPTKSSEITSLLSGAPNSSSLGGGGMWGGSSSGGIGSNPQGAAAGGSRGVATEEAGETGFLARSVKRFCVYFDVDTQEVATRMLNSVLGVHRGDFDELVGDNPDLYGPFWIATTLVFLTAAIGNYAAYMKFESTEENKLWHYSIKKVTYAAVLFYWYVGLGPLLWAIVYKAAGLKLRARGVIGLCCLMGYSLSIFIPTSFLCIIPHEALQWTLMFVASFWSCGFLIMNLRNGDENDPKMEMLALAALGAVHMVNFAVLITWVLYH